MVELVDTRGTFCPVPILLAARKARQLAVGDRLELLGDDPGILHDLPDWCQATGHRLVSMHKTGGSCEELETQTTIRCIVEIATSTVLNSKVALD